ncbi:flagellar FlbD family protein [Halalkalibacter nanhaiisediminis]|uniref:flagellar FlbD family protein n=1 Tax=Halalkalibacter nanhaiisediminis TaxID=688079 RepID=UPI003463168D
MRRFGLGSKHLAHPINIMIELIRLNGQPFLLNAMLIEQIEALPDTTITLMSGKKIVVRNEINEVKAIINSQFVKIGLIAVHKDVEGS